MGILSWIKEKYYNGQPRCLICYYVQDYRHDLFCKASGVDFSIEEAIKSYPDKCKRYCDAYKELVKGLRQLNREG